MINPKPCQIKHNPPHSYGDCIRACIASMLNDDSVPHTFKGNDAELSWKELRAYLRSRGKLLALFDVDDPFEFMGDNNPGIPYLLLCRNKNGDHAVVCQGNKVIHDPAWYRTDITGPHSSGFWIVGVICAAL